jgi:hypothetical protein
VFDAAYSKEVAGEDAPKLGNPSANFAIETAGKLLAIEGTQPAKEGDAVQYRMWNIAQGSYSLELEPKAMNLTEGLTALLEDSYLATSTPISAATTVKFTVNSDTKSSAPNRFKVVFAKAKAPAAATKQAYTIAPNPIENGMMNLKLDNQPAGKYAVRILGTGGNATTVKTIVHAGGSASQTISLPAAMAAGTYTVEIVAPNKTRSTQTILVNKK